MTKFFQSLTILNLAGLLLLGMLWFKSKETSQTAVPSTAKNSPTAPTLSPMSTAPTASTSHEGHDHSANNASTPTITPMTSPSAINPTPVQMGEIKGEPGKPQTVDVTCGHAVDRSVYGDYDGNRVFFHSPANKTQFESNVSKNLQKIKEKGIVLEKAPVG